MKKSEIINLLLELLEAVCKVMGKLTAELVDRFPALEKYLIAFISGAQSIINKFLPESAI